MELQNEKTVESEDKFKNKNTPTWGDWIWKSFAFKAPEQKLGHTTK
jgi:hypothetical protein